MKRLAAAPIVMVLAACVSTPPGSEIITIKVHDPAEEQAIRRQTYLVEEAVQLAVIAYELEQLTIDIIIHDLGALGQTTPDFNPLLHVNASTISLSTTLFIDPEPDLDAVLTGLMAHEVAHAFHYAHMSDVDLLQLGEHYKAFSSNPDGHMRDWAEAYEQLTDMTAIAHGFAEPLIAQKRASADNITHHHPKHVWNFYLTPDEIHMLDQDRIALRDRMLEAAHAVNLPSLTRLVTSIDVEPSDEASRDALNREPTHAGVYALEEGG